MRVVEAVDVRAHEAHVVLARHGDDLVLQGVLADLREPGGDEDGPGDALLAALGKRPSDQRRRDAEDGDVDVAGNVDDARVALAVENDVRLGMDGVERALVAAVDEVLHHRVADLALAGGGADDRHGVGLHDAAHGGQDVLLLGPVTGLRRGLQEDARIDRTDAVGRGEDGVQVEFVDLGHVRDEAADRRDECGEGAPVDAGRAAHAVEHGGPRDFVEHRRGFVLGRGRQPEGQVPEHLDQDAAEAEGDQLAECRIRHGPHDDFRGAVARRELALHEHAVDGGVGVVCAGPLDHLVARFAERVVRVEADDHAADVGLVQDVAGLDLGDHRIADLGGDRAGFVA